MDEIKRLRHTADEIDAAIDILPDISDVYSKSEVNALLNSKADAANFSAFEERLAALEAAIQGDELEDI